MSRKIFQSLVQTGIVAGFIFGLYSMFSTEAAQDWISQKLYWLSLAEGVSRINQSTVTGFAVALFLSFILLILVLLWKKYFSHFIEVNITKKKNLQPWIRGLGSFSLIAFSILLLIKHSSHKIQMVPLVLSQMIILSVLFFFLFSNKKTKHPKTQIKSPLPGFTSLKKTSAACLILLIAANLIHFAHRQFFKPQSPNVLIIVADTLRADHLNSYGYSRLTSPNIDRFSKNSLHFEKHMSNAAWTKPSMGTFFTSLYPHEHSAFSWLDNLSDSAVTLAEVFLDRNYKTMAIQTNPTLSNENNFSQGFQEYLDLPLEKGTKVTDAFFSWIKKNNKKPFFAYLHFMDTHMPYNAPEEFRQIFHLDKTDPDGSLDLISLDIRVLTELGISQRQRESVLNLYDNAVLQFDLSFERILQSLKKLKQLENTIIVLTSDHGEEFWDHESFGHGHTNYNELLHVPLIIGNAPLLSSRRITHFTQHLDVFPAILSLVGINKTPFQRDKEKMPLLLDKEKSRSNPIFFEAVLSGKEKRGVIKENWKLIENTNQQTEGIGATLGDLEKFRAPLRAGIFELYDLTQDPFETTNLNSLNLDLSSELKKLILGKFSTEARLVQQKKSDLEKKIESMKNLGYIK
ncbi:sulfatase [Acidobacteriota bacterium]